MARSLMYAHAKIPPALWAEMISAAVYILNRTGPTSVDGKSPYELWHQKKPRLSHLRIIGSICYPHVPKQRRKKLDKKAQKGILIGYDSDNGYRIWDSNSFKLIRSRDVTFNENPLLGHFEEIDEPVANQNKTADKNSNTLFDFVIPRQHECYTPADTSNIQQTLTSHDESIASSSQQDEHAAESSCAEIETASEDDVPEAETFLEAEESFYEPISEEEVSDVIETDRQVNDINESRPDRRDDSSLSASEIEAEGRMTLRDRSNLRPPAIQRLHLQHLYEWQFDKR
ncbi:unnamed protein product [Arctia plantaginis]|uniref:Retroviral polymerase SH3-like domain-containing protein n=1 Tax=Arctia plantaginis TaxID=874455 RepID=A0A8S1AX96_ARCPL|nr:unnamed protein product [Arctia plantaginis]